MTSMKRSKTLVVLVGLLAFAVFMAPSSVAAPPSNDNFADAAVIMSLPFSSTVGITEATIQSGEPIDETYYQGRTVWYSITPTVDAVLRVGPGATGGTPFLVVYRADGAGFPGLTRIAGDNWSSATTQTLHVQAGTTYFVQGGDRYANFGFTDSFSLEMSLVLPPPNDNFAGCHRFCICSVLRQP